jgi:nitrate/TMAO reductase-like tetraheme cytochrome c subunit
MQSESTKFGWLSPVVYLASNSISLLGILLTTTGGVAWLFLIPLGVTGEAANPYLGILFYVLLPAIFFGGLALIPLGIYNRQRRERKRGFYPAHFPPLNWQNTQFRRLVLFIGLATAFNVVIGGHFTYTSVEYMDSVTFCGQTCHTIMTPEFTAFQQSPHFRVSCTDCHIGEGASWFVQSKLSGAGQVFATLLNTYPRPVPTPVHNLRPARETCEACHWPEKFTGYRLRIVPKFAADEQNSASKNVLLLRIGGGPVKTGIHGFHLAPGVVVEYRSDPSRQAIPWVRYTSASGEVTEYATEDWDPAQAEESEMRVMDCIDCHNRPTHTFQMPERAVDEALAEGRIDPALPFVKKQALEIIQAEYPSTEQAKQAIPAALTEYYQREHPDMFQQKREEIERSAQGLFAVWDRNIFPEMKVTWGTYPNNIGHTDFPGCFRCHDDLHAAAGGETIRQDCSSCHELLAMEEAAPEILGQLGIND